MKQTTNNFQSFYASRFVSVLLAAVAIEIFIIVLAIFGGGR
jgi:hypothetical protein